MTLADTTSLSPPSSQPADVIFPEAPGEGATEAEWEAYLEEMCGLLADDPVGWARWAFPWGEGELEDIEGPDVWQDDFLDELGREIRKRDFNGQDAVDPVRFSTSSGHGIGKSALIAILILFIMSTRPGSKGTVTANTGVQLEARTWAELAKWKRLCIVGHWFGLNSGRGSLKLWHRGNKEEWVCNGILWQERNPAAFQGQHAATATSFYIYDEASAIPRKIIEAGQGGLTDGEPMEFMFGNPNESSGYFFDTHHHDRIKSIYIRRKIDSRTCRFPNKRVHEEWIRLYGIESDFVKVRVLGEFPALSPQQLIATDIIERAAKNKDPVAHLTDPLIFGLDVARNGDCESVLYIRKGRDGIAHKMMIHRGDTVLLSRKVANLAKAMLPDAIFVDGGGMGGPVVDMLRSLNAPNVIEILFGAPSPDEDYGNMAAYMWEEANKFLKRDGAAIHDDYDLKSQLWSRKFFTAKDKKWLIPKEQLIKDGDPSPDRADAFCLTFAMPVGPRDPGKTKRQALGGGDNNSEGASYDPHSRR